MKRVPAVVIAGVLVLGGCTGFVTQDSTETVTPVPVPTDRDRYPPGVSEDVVVGSALASAHARSLATTNYTLVSRQRVTANSTVLERSVHVRSVAANGTVYGGQFRQYDRTSRVPTTRVDYWSNGTIVAVRYSDQINHPRLVRWNIHGHGPITDLTNEWRVHATAEAVALRVVERTGNGGVVIVGRRFSDPDRLITPVFVENPRNVSARLRVTNGGIVVFQRLEYDARRGTQSVHVSRETRVTAVGSTTVERPTWVDNTTARSEGR